MSNIQHNHEAANVNVVPEAIVPAAVVPAAVVPAAIVPAATVPPKKPHAGVKNLTTMK